MDAEPVDDLAEQAEAYMMACLDVVIPLMPSEADMRSWWKEEEYNRIKYGLTPQQVDQLVTACAQKKRTFPYERKFKGFI